MKATEERKYGMLVPSHFYSKHLDRLKVEVFIEYRINIFYPRKKEEPKWKETTAPTFKKCGECKGLGDSDIVSLARKGWDELLSECSAKTLIHKPECFGIIIIRKEAQAISWKP